MTIWPGSNHVVRLLHGNHSFQQRRSPGASAQQVCNSFLSKLIKYFNKEIFAQEIYLSIKIISHTINQILSKNGPVHKSWLSLEWPGSLLDFRQPTVRFPENPKLWFPENHQIWFHLPLGTSRLTLSRTLDGTTWSGLSQGLLVAPTEVRLKSSLTHHANHLNSLLVFSSQF